MLKPKVGMPILFKVPDDAVEGAGQPFFSATICAVHEDGTVNLAVFDQNGLDAPVQNAVLVQAAGDCEAYCMTPVQVETEPTDGEDHPDAPHRRRHRAKEE